MTNQQPMVNQAPNAPSRLLSGEVATASAAGTTVEDGSRWPKRKNRPEERTGFINYSTYIYEKKLTLLFFYNYVMWSQTIT